MPATEYQVSKFATLGAVMAIIHSVPQPRWFLVSMIHITNTDVNDQVVNLCYVPPGGVPAQSNAILWGYVIPASDFIELGAGDRIDPGWTIQASSGTDNAVNLKLAGTESSLVKA